MRDIVAKKQEAPHLAEEGSMYLSPSFLNWLMTLVLFRTRRRDECSRQKEGVRRRVRKSRQKEAAGAADAGPMQIEWSVKAAGVVAGAPVQRRVDGRSEPTRGQEEDVWM